jgi:hypothetical protein
MALGPVAHPTPETAPRRREGSAAIDLDAILPFDQHHLDDRAGAKRLSI